MISVFNSWRRQLYLKWIWVRYTYRFNWAHKPLCEKYRQDFLKIADVHICRSCLLVYLGIILGGSLGLFFHEGLREVGVVLFICSSAVTLVFSYPKWYRSRHRLVRDGLRFMLGISIALCGYLLFYGNWVVGIVGGVSFFTLWKAYMRLRNRRRVHACDGCGDLKKNEICPGYEWQAEFLKQYEQKASEYIMMQGVLPQSFGSANRSN